MPGSALGSAYSQALSASGGTGAYTWSLSAGTLPNGLSLSSSGTISGDAGRGGHVELHGESGEWRVERH
ncbi:MAG: Ig domain-containing protein [Ignavibacteriota bacterium]